MYKLSSQSGASMVELAFILSLCLALIFGTTSIGDYYVRRIQAHNISFVSSFATKVYCSSADLLSRTACLEWIHQNWDQYRSATGIDATNHIAMYVKDAFGGVSKTTGLAPDTAEGYTAFALPLFTGGDPVMTDMANQIEWIATSDVYIKSSGVPLDMLRLGEVGYSSFM